MDILYKHIIALQNIVEQSGEQLEGNCFYYHQTLHLAPELQAKQRNLLKVASQLMVPLAQAPILVQGLVPAVQNPRILEIGFNAGHSLLLFLMKQPAAHYVVFDICMHSYVKPCFEYLKSQFPQATLELIEGDSMQTVENYRTDELFDLIHVDGGHAEEVAASDMKHAVRLCRKGGYIILDDTNDTAIAAVGRIYEVAGAILIAPQFEETALYQHQIYVRI